MVVRVENNNGGQNVGGPRSGENQGSALGQLRNTFVSYSVEEQVIRAELWWVLKMVESDFSFKSADNMVKLLCLMDKDSKIFPKMTLGRHKCGYISNRCWWRNPICGCDKARHHNLLPFILLVNSEHY